MYTLNGAHKQNIGFLFQLHSGVIQVIDSSNFAYWQILRYKVDAVPPVVEPALPAMELWRGLS